MGVEVFVIILDFLVDILDVLRVVSREGNIFRINFYSDVEDVIFKIVFVVIKGKCI